MVMELSSVAVDVALEPGESVLGEAAPGELTPREPALGATGGVTAAFFLGAAEPLPGITVSASIASRTPHVRPPNRSFIPRLDRIACLLYPAF
jgi:hypothetical protein